MDDLLPKISVKIDTDQPEFLKRIENLISQKNILEKDYKKSKAEPWVSLAFKVSDTELKEPFCVIISDTKDEERMELQLRASSWPVEPLTYDLYSSKSREHFAPLISTYNKNFNSKRRIHVQPQESLEPILPKVAQDKFDSFVSMANIQVPHKLDWDRFYRFVAHCHANNVQIWSEDLLRILIKAGFSEDTAERFSDAYRHIRRYHRDKYF